MHIALLDWLSSYVPANLYVSSLYQNKCFEIGTLHWQPTEALMSEVKICVTSDINVAGGHKYDHKMRSIVLIIIVILPYERKKRLDRTHIVFDTIARENGGCHHDSLMWVTIWTRVSHVGRTQRECAVRPIYSHFVQIASNTIRCSSDKTAHLS